MEARLRQAAAAVRDLREAFRHVDQPAVEAARARIGLVAGLWRCLEIEKIELQGAKELVARKEKSRELAVFVFWFFDRLQSTSPSNESRDELWRKACRELGPFVPARTTHDRILRLGIAIQAYKVDYGQLPAAADITALLSKLSPTYIRAEDAADLALDGWGTELRVWSGADTYRIVSAGADRLFAPETWETASAGLPVEQDCVFSNDTYVRSWQLETEPLR